MLSPFFDTHCHLGGGDLHHKAKLLTENAIQAHVMGLTIVAADEESLDKAQEQHRELSKLFPDMTLRWSAGIHPHDATKVDDRLWKKVEDAAATAHAIGETGLDYHYMHSDKTSQIELFDKHIDLACRTQKPLILHCRETKNDILDRLKASPALKSHPRPGILHCFTEDEATALELIEMGFMISFSGIMTFKNASHLRDIAAKLPLDKILIETDSPWLAPVPRRGKENEPAFVAHVFDCLKNLRSEKPEIIAEQLWQNSCNTFRI